MVGGWSAPRPGRFTPGKDPVPFVQEDEWGPQGRSGRVRKISPTTGIRSPDRPDRSESLYRLSYPGPHMQYRDKIKSLRSFCNTTFVMTSRSQISMSVQILLKQLTENYLHLFAPAECRQIWRNSSHLKHHSAILLLSNPTEKFSNYFPNLYKRHYNSSTHSIHWRLTWR
jgi:hypothetical protein